MQPRIQIKYKEEVFGMMLKEFEYPNPMMVPRLNKIVVNTTFSEALQNAKLLTSIAEELTLITGQKSIITKARRSIANFKLREGQALGAKVTLRGQKMWEFFDRFTAIAIPRIRDFRGLEQKGFDGRGNYNMGIIEQIVFPELSYDRIKKINGMNITFVTSAKTDKEAMTLLRFLGMPFQN